MQKEVAEAKTALGEAESRINQPAEQEATDEEAKAVRLTEEQLKAVREEEATEHGATIEALQQELAATKKTMLENKEALVHADAASKEHAAAMEILQRELAAAKAICLHTRPCTCLYSSLCACLCTCL